MQSAAVGILCGEGQGGDRAAVRGFALCKCAKDAPVVFVPCFRSKGIAPKYFNIDMSAAVENLLLEADELGLGAVWMGISPDEGRMKAVREVLDIPEDLHAFALIPCGYPAEERAQEDRYEESRVHYIRN